MHVSYGPLVRKLCRSAPGQGPGPYHRRRLLDNIPRVLPKNCDVVIRKGSWDVPPIFQLIERRGGVDEDELYQVFNMGIGMTVIVPADQADAT